MVNWIKRVIEFLTVDIWKVRLSQLTGKRSFLIRSARVLMISGRDFYSDRCLMRASGLTFYTMLSLVPTLALMFALARSFGLDKDLKDQIFYSMRGQEEVAQWLINFTEQQIGKAQGGVIAGVGFALLFWAVIRLLTYVERSLNDIWNVKVPRSFTRRLADYISVVIVVPILLVASASAMVLLKTKLGQWGLGPINTVLFMALPVLMTWLTFLFIYKMMPNTKVNFRSALLAGVIAGTAFMIAQWGYIKFQVGLTRYSTVYGSLAALPAFLIWIQLTWVILLFGAEISCAHQNVQNYDFQLEWEDASPRLSRLIALYTTQMIVKNFDEGKPPLTVLEISGRSDIPIRILQDILFKLVQNQIVAETDCEEERAYLPARSPDALTAAMVVTALDNQGINEITLKQTPELEKITKILEGLEESEEKSPSNIVLRDI